MLGGVGGDAPEIRLSQIAFDLRPLFRVLGKEVDVHLVGPELGALVAKVGEVQADGLVLGLAKCKRSPAAVVVAADEDVVGAGKRRATNQGVNAVQVAPPGGAAPVMKGLVETRLGANDGRLIGGAPMGLVGLGYILLVHQHGPVPALTLSLEPSSNKFADDEFKTGRRRFVRTNLEHHLGRIKLMKD